MSPSIGAIESGAGQVTAQATAFGPELSAYVGRQFERVCLQWVVRQNRAGGLPFVASSFGSWWGADPEAREQADIDVVAADVRGKQLLVGECKWRNEFNETAALEALERRSRLLRGFACRQLILFSKFPVSAAMACKTSAREDIRLVTADDLFAGLE